jgi:hypothetical protein
MKRTWMFVLGIALLAVMITGVAGAAPDSQDNRRLRWDRFDVTIDNVVTGENRFDVTETYELTIETGPFRFGTAEIPTDRLDTIRNVAVYDGEMALRETCGGGAGTFCVSQFDDTFSLTYYFLQAAESGQRRTIRLKYTVFGALRSYDDGDQLYWVAVPGDRPFPVLDSRVTVTLPSDRPPEVTASYPDTWAETIDGTTVIWEAPGSLGTSGEVEVRVQYPHDPSMSKAGWQAGFDRMRWYEDNLKPIVTLLLLVIGALIGFGGSLLIIMRYLSHGRDPEAVVVPEYLPEPPSDELPGIVGVLLDERADMKDILGTMLDLARRGYLVIEQTSGGGVLGMFENTEFHFHRTDKDSGSLRGYEKALLRGLFPGKRTDTKLSDLRNKFYKVIPAIKEQMYRDLVKQGYFTRSPETTRNLWLFGGIGLMVLAGIGFWGGLAATVISPLMVAPPIGVGLVGLVMAVASQAMPAKTPKGAQEAARWQAFRTYLKNIESYTDLSQVTDHFEKYIGYAMAFGFEKDWIRDFAPVMTAMPTWYFPTHLGGPWGRGYYHGWPSSGSGSSGGGLGGLDFEGPGGLNSMSRSLTDGLNSMNTGLTKMLNDASGAMTSRPSSSGSGGGFSGGGGGGGGGSGGGSRGFG